MEKENINLLTRKIKIYPNKKQKILLKQYIGTCRFVYNKTIDHVNDLERIQVYEESKDGSYIKYNEDTFVYVGKGCGTHVLKTTLKPQFYTKVDKKSGKETIGRVNQTGFKTMRPLIKKELPIWTKNVPSHLIDNSIIECSKNWKNLFEKTRITGEHQEMKYKSKKDNVETITLDASMISTSKYNCIFTRTIGVVKASERFINNGYESKLQYNKKTKEWYLYVIKEYKEKEEEHKHPFDLVGVDPGEKIFLNLYCTDKGKEHILSICKENRDLKMFNYLKRADLLQSFKTKVSRKRKSGITKAINRIYKKVKNMKKDMHNKIALFMAKNYKHILLPKYECKQMMSKLTTKVCRSMYTLSFYMFKQKLKQKCDEYGTKLYSITEEYTTKACCKCGTFNIPDNREYKCRECEIEIHRDDNGSVNMVLKNIK